MGEASINETLSLSEYIENFCRKLKSPCKMKSGLNEKLGNMENTNVGDYSLW